MDIKTMDILFYALGLILLLGCLFIGYRIFFAKDDLKGKPHYRIVLASDIHYPSKKHKGKSLLKAKQAALACLNRLQNVSLVVFLGDMINKDDSPSTVENAIATTYGSCTQLKTMVLGNHELSYAVATEPQEGWEIVFDDIARVKRFVKRAFGLEELYYSEQLGKYLLIFLAPDCIAAKYKVTLSEEQIAWLQQSLEANRDKPIIIFCHAPLKGTVGENKKNACVHPSSKIKSLIKQHANVKLWCSGHVHLPAEKLLEGEDYKHAQACRNPDWEREDIACVNLNLYDKCIQVTVTELYKQEDNQKEMFRIAV